MVPTNGSPWLLTLYVVVFDQPPAPCIMLLRAKKRDRSSYRHLKKNPKSVYSGTNESVDATTEDEPIGFLGSLLVFKER